MTTNTLAPQKLYFLRLSVTTIHMAGRALELAMGCYLVQMSDGRNVLIDSGLPENYVSPFISPQEMPVAEQRKNVIEVLDTLGLRPENIDMLICTHFDPDHSGYHDAFTKAEFVVQREHYALARSGHPRFAATRAHWDAPALHYRMVDGDTELLPGLTLLETSGHTLGHQSVLVHLPQAGPVLLAIDAVAMQRLFTPERKAWPMDDNEEQLRASTRKLLEIVEREHVALVSFGHDGEQWQTLKTAPEYYG